jgi:hypothetical protein
MLISQSADQLIIRGQLGGVRFPGAAPAAVFTGYVISLKSIANTLARREPSWVKSANAAR